MEKKDIWSQASLSSINQVLAPAILGASKSIDYLGRFESIITYWIFSDGTDIQDRKLIRRAILLPERRYSSSAPPGGPERRKHDMIESFRKKGWSVKGLRSETDFEFLLIDGHSLFLPSGVSGSHGGWQTMHQSLDPGDIEAAVSLIGSIWTHDQLGLGYQSFVTAEPKHSHQEIVVVSSARFQEVLQRLEVNPRRLIDLTPREFEEFTADLLEHRGFRVKLTPETRDGGRDILAHYATPAGEILYLVECKRNKNLRPVDVSVVRALYGVLEIEGANAGMIVTTSRFSKDATKLAREISFRMQLRDYNDVVSWVQEACIDLKW